MSVTLKPVGEQVIVITGATSGIGLATAREASRRGARLVLCSRDEDDLRQVADELSAQNKRAIYAVADVADLDSMQMVADRAVSSFGRIDTWINDAGTSIYGMIEDIPLDDAERMFRTNYWGVVNGSLVALPHLKKNGGVLINLGSEVSETAIPLQGHYVASKHAVKGFTDTLRLELEKNNEPVVVTLIQPAAIDTQFLDHSKTYLGVVPNHVPPVYDAKVVAEAILECAESPHRNVRVGGAAKLYTSIEKVAPTLGDKMKERTAFDGSMTNTPKGPDDDTLWQPRSGDVSESGSYQGRVKKSSLYTTAALHPVAALLGAAALGVGIAAMVATNRGD
jgi:short-subunit dehydrogenase